MAFGRSHHCLAPLLNRCGARGSMPPAGAAPPLWRTATRTAAGLLQSSWLLAMLLASAAGAEELGDRSDRDAAPAASLRPAKMIVDQDVVFASPDGATLRCDIYRTASTESLRPAVLVIHGGGWSTGDKWTMAGPARQMASAGLVAVAINYRLAPDHPFPAQLDDVRLAFDWIRANADTYDIDPTRIGVFGYSAGGHLAAMLAVMADEPVATQQATSRLAEDHPLLHQPVRPAAVVAGGAPCEFRTLPPDNTILAYFFGGSRREKPSLYRNASPTAHASHNDVAILFLHGAGDLLVPPRSARQLFEKHRELGVSSQWYELDDLGHLFAFLSPDLRGRAVRYLAEELSAAEE